MIPFFQLTPTPTPTSPVAVTTTTTTLHARVHTIQMGCDLQRGGHPDRSRMPIAVGCCSQACVGERGDGHVVCFGRSFVAHAQVLHQAIVSCLYTAVLNTYTCIILGTRCSLSIVLARIYNEPP